MLLLEHHGRVGIPGLEHVVQIVLAAHRQYHALSSELQQRALPDGVGLAGIIPAQLYAIGAILAEHATPQRVVQVQNETLLALKIQLILDAAPPDVEIAGQLRVEQRL